MAEPTKRFDTLNVQTIHPVVEYQKLTSFSSMSKCNPMSRRWAKRSPPCECTMALGLPVVPEEKRMTKGWLNGTGSKVGSTLSAVNAS